MRILELEAGQVSLEMGPDEALQVLSQLDKGGGFMRSKGATHEILSKGSLSLIFMDEWDEPALLSMDEAGAVLLRSLAGDESRNPARMGARG
jgi:hypothetical protein